ncbi:MAG TPA: GlsB/YeaQ/YmgE family stress response membrane protein [Gammaproteobacteria bacterium]|nr:GlsB/YeaQ/YmgE family stress response membrane protein [Gammaproteobacteria bacterium]
MDIINLIIFLAVGALAGWLAGQIVKGSGFGVIGNIIVGIVGAVLGGFVFGLLGITTGGLLGAIVMAVIGAVILLYIINLLQKTS